MLQGSLGTLSNRETYVQDIQVLDENGDAIDLTDGTIVFELRDHSTKVSALIATDVTISTTTFTVRLETTDTATLDPKQYDLGITILLDGDTTQLFAGTIDVVDGIVS